MIAMMERCASVLSWENLDEGKATVGFEVCVKHVAAAPRGRHLHASRRGCARSRTAASSASTSEVRDGDRTIGVGTHERRVIDRSSFGG